MTRVFLLAIAVLISTSACEGLNPFRAYDFLGSAPEATDPPI